MSRTQALGALLSRSRLDRLARLSWRGLLIFNYHRIGTPTEHDDPDIFSCTAADLDRHVALLADRFEIVAAGAADLDAERPARRVAITVDDGYADMAVAADVLRRRGVPGTFFVTTGFVDRPRPAWWDEIAWLTRPPVPRALPASRWLPDGLDTAGRPPEEVRRTVTGAYKQRAGDAGEAFLDHLADVTGRERLADGAAAGDRWLTWDGVRALRDAGMEIGAHTVTHPVLATLSEERQRAEIAGSLERLRAELGTPVDTFSYPVGARTSFDDRTRGLLADLGVRRAYSFYGGTNDRSPDPHDIRRVGVYWSHTPEAIAAIAAVPALLG